MNERKDTYLEASRTGLANNSLWNTGSVEAELSLGAVYICALIYWDDTETSVADLWTGAYMG